MLLFHAGTITVAQRGIHPWPVGALGWLPSCNYVFTQSEAALNPGVGTADPGWPLGRPRPRGRELGHS